MSIECRCWASCSTRRACTATMCLHALRLSLRSVEMPTRCSRSNGRTRVIDRSNTCRFGMWTKARRAVGSRASHPARQTECSTRCGPPK